MSDSSKNSNKRGRKVGYIYSRKKKDSNLETSDIVERILEYQRKKYG